MQIIEYIKKFIGNRFNSDTKIIARKNKDFNLVELSQRLERDKVHIIFKGGKYYRIRELGVLILFMLLIPSCYKEPVTYWDDAPELFDLKGFKEYHIKKGEHRSGNYLSFTVSNHIEAYIQLTETCNYDLNLIDQLDINKLIGLSDAVSHSDSSVRFGWRSVNNQLEIHAYIRYKGKHSSYFLGTVKPDEVFYTKIEIYPNEYKLKLRNEETIIGRESEYTGVRYKLYPYFGGNKTAPHNILIRIKEV